MLYSDIAGDSDQFLAPLHESRMGSSGIRTENGDWNGRISCSSLDRRSEKLRKLEQPPVRKTFYSKVNKTISTTFINYHLNISTINHGLDGCSPTACGSLLWMEKPIISQIRMFLGYICFEDTFSVWEMGHQEMLRWSNKSWAPTDFKRMVWKRRFDECGNCWYELRRWARWIGSGSNLKESFWRCSIVYSRCW